MKKNNNDILYIIPFSLYCFMSLSGGSRLIELDNSIKIILYTIIILLFGIKIVINKLSLREICIYTIIGFISVYAYIKLETIFFLMNFLAIISLKNVDIKKVVKVDIAIKGVFFITHSTLYIIDYFFDYNNIEQFIIYDEKRVRHALYFIHPNIVNSMVFWMIMDIFYLKRNIKFRHILISSIIIGIMYEITKSRTMSLLFIIFLFIYYMERITKNKDLYYNIINTIQKYIIEFFTILSIAIGVLYKYNIHFITTFLNALTSGRVYYSYAAINDFGINFLCNAKAINLEKNLLLVDNFYIRCTVLYGLIFILLIIIMTKLTKKDNKFMLDKIMFIILAISLFSEYFGIIIGNAIPLLLLGNMIINRNEKVDNKNKTLLLMKGK